MKNNCNLNFDVNKYNKKYDEFIKVCDELYGMRNIFAQIAERYMRVRQELYIPEIDAVRNRIDGDDITVLSNFIISKQEYSDL